MIEVARRARIDDSPPAAEERHGVGLVGELAGIVREIMPCSSRTSANGSSVAPVTALTKVAVRFGDEAFLAINEDEANRGIGPRKEAIDLGRLDLDHAGGRRRVAKARQRRAHRLTIVSPA